jgi:hypothetical protein
VSGIFSSIIASFVTIPLLGYIIVFVISKCLTKKHHKSVRIALDFTTCFLVLAVHYLIKAIWGISLLWVIFIVMILVAVLFVLMHWKTRQEIDFVKVLKGFWRFNFLLFSCAYLLLLIYGLISRVRMTITL